MKEYNSEILKEVHTELEIVDMESCNISLEEAESMINFLNDCLEKMRSYFLSLDSIDSSDEICFFKEIKPEVLGFLLYFNKVHAIELKCPNGSNDTLKSYYENEQESLTYFFERNIDFYQYYRSKSTYLDEHYFLRKKKSYKLCVDSVHFVMDKHFSTGYDYKVAKIICNEMLRIYLNKKKHQIEKQIIINKNRSSFPINDLKWTGPLIALVELGYSFDSSKYVNRGKADVKEIMIGLETLFNVDLGEYYRTYISIKDRKIERAKYLKIITDNFLRRMDEDDSK
ncbi:MAG: hypothetical protein BGO34_00425 [Bacteroidia bacterium 44-10]|nr:MAG: hypothetical protein BGO34_00425 [Bacteroidia bacterium 44-10]